RLIPALGADGAAELAHALFADTWNLATRLPGTTAVLATTDPAAPSWRELNADIWPQGAGTLGDRMERVVRRALRTHPYAIVIGTDLPGLPAARLRAAQRALANADAVIGPADDGGFYLIGFRTCPRGLLRGLSWSTPDVFRHTRARLRARGLRTRTIGAWFDVDEPADLVALRRRLRRPAIQAPAVRAWLARRMEPR
ncbi:MAG: DUF2064 domain-containing protein, partial [Acidobacteria bacterium]